MPFGDLDLELSNESANYFVFDNGITNIYTVTGERKRDHLPHFKVLYAIVDLLGRLVGLTSRLSLVRTASKRL